MNRFFERLPMAGSSELRDGKILAIKMALVCWLGGYLVVAFPMIYVSNLWGVAAILFAVNGIGFLLVVRKIYHWETTPSVERRA